MYKYVYSLTNEVFLKLHCFALSLQVTVSGDLAPLIPDVVLGNGLDTTGGNGVS